MCLSQVEYQNNFMNTNNVLDEEIAPIQKKDLVLVEQSQKKRMDSFFIHQCIIRRFKHNYPTDYDALLTIRNEIESVLCLSGLREVPKDQFELSSTEVTLALMGFIENNRNRNLLKYEEDKHIRDRLYKHLNVTIKSTLDIKDYLSECDMDRIIDFLKKDVGFYKALIKKYNMFDYFSLFSMTVYIPFDKFYKFYRDSFHGKNKVYGALENVTREVKWLYTMEYENDSNIYISIVSDCCNSFFYSSNVQIIDDERNDIVINGVKSHNALYLKVPVNQSPNNIDAAIEYYKDAIIEQLINNFGCMVNIHDDGFESSKFLKFYNKDAYLVTQWNCIDNNIFGLWCWDLVRNENNTETKAASDIAAIALPLQALQLLKTIVKSRVLFYLLTSKKIRR